VLLRALGYGDDAFLERFVRLRLLEGSGGRSATSPPTREEALLEIYKRARPASRSR